MQPGDHIVLTGEIVEKVSRSKMTPKGKIDVWLDSRHTIWKAYRFIQIERLD